MVNSTDVVQDAATAAGIITEIEALEPDSGYYIVPTRTPRGDAAFVEALRIARHPITRENLLRLVRELHISNALEPAISLLSDGDADVRGAAADTVGELASFPLMPVSDARQQAAREALLSRWDVEADDMVRSCLAYSLVALAEPRMRPLFEACLTDRDDRVRRLGKAGLSRLEGTESTSRPDRVGTTLQGKAGRYDYADLAEHIHHNCIDSDPYGLALHPRQRHIRRVLEYGYRIRPPGENTVIIRGRFFDLVIEENRSAGWAARVTDPEGLSACRRTSDHRHRLLLRPLTLDPEHHEPTDGPADDPPT